ncbi:MAG: undecaprenyl-diphosphate phosphatase [Proteobacteria bacterium]|nr:undecaprenyl-diphosphate phosphatase [Pseudomonadota bacterium]
MGMLQLIVLAVVQGLTEFLPVSSSGHLVLVPSIFGWTDQGLAFDVAVHFGSLVAVCIFFRFDIAALLRGARAIITGNVKADDARMVWYLGLATVPAALTGLLFASWIATNLRDPLVVVVTLSGYGIVMALADQFAPKERNITDIRLRDALIIGLAQALALIPGTSRSGVTITVGRLLGIARQDAARFSFLLSVPVILLATIYEAVILITGDIQVAWDTLALAGLISAIVAYLSIEFFMRVISVIGLLPFAIYRLILAGVIFYALI